MKAEPPNIPDGVLGPAGVAAASTITDAAATFATRTRPVLQALDAVLAEDAAGLAQVLAAAEAQRPGMTLALAAALAAEAEHLRRLAVRAEVAAARLRHSRGTTEPADIVSLTIQDT